MISIAQYLIDKDEHTTLYKISQTYKYTHKLKKYNINIIFLTCTHTCAHTHTHTHAHTCTHTHTSTHAHKPQICGSAERRMQRMKIGGWGVGKKEDGYDNLTELYTFIGAVVSLTLFQMPHQPDLLLI